MELSLEQLQGEQNRRQLVNLDEQDDLEIAGRGTANQMHEILLAEQNRRIEAARPREEITYLDVASDVAGGMNEAILDVADMVTSPLRVAGEFISGKDVRAPSEVMSKYGIGGDKRFVDDEWLSNFSNGFGYFLTSAAGLKGVPRDPGAFRNVIADIIGAGSSELTVAQQSARKTIQALDSIDNEYLGLDPSIWDKETIVGEAQSYLDLGNIVHNRKNMNAYDAALEELAVFESKKGTKENMAQPIFPDVENVGGIGTVIRYLEEIGVKPSVAMDAIRDAGGLKFRSMEELVELDKMFTKVDGSGTRVNWYDNNFLPVADVMKNKVDRRLGGLWERTIESNMRFTALFANKHKPLIRVVKAINDDRGLKRLLLDLPTGKATIEEVRHAIRTRLDSDAVRAFDSFMGDSEAQNARALDTIFKEDEKFAGDWYLHTEKSPKGKGSIADSIGRIGEASTEKPSALRDRTRKPASMMTDEEVDAYMNPLITHMRYLGEQDQLIRMAESFQLRPSLGKNDNLEVFWGEVNKKLRRDGVDSERADLGSKLMASTYMNAKKTPPPAVRAFMSLSYAGTLSQLKTAILNLHDLFVSGFTQGGVNTAKGMRTTLVREFGKSFDELGLGGQSVGEFVKGGMDALEDPSVMNQVAETARKLTEGSMLISGFRMFDQYGKATVLKAAVQNMRQAAKLGNLSEKFGDIATRNQLRQIRPYLQTDMPVKDYPQRVAAIVEELAFVQLGKQQLISYAGRPLGYLKNPLLRPAYAMTGFAVKQQALLRDLVVRNWQKGNYQAAGQFAMGYILYAGVGYAGLDTFRNSVIKREPQDEKDFVLAVVDQIMGAMFMNKFDTGSMGRLGANPIDYIMQAFLPPGGLTEAAAQDLSTFIRSLADGDIDPPTKLLERFPLLGDFYKHWWKD